MGLRVQMARNAETMSQMIEANSRNMVPFDSPQYEEYQQLRFDQARRDERNRAQRERRQRKAEQRMFAAAAAESENEIVSENPGLHLRERYAEAMRMSESESESNRSSTESFDTVSDDHVSSSSAESSIEYPISGSDSSSGSLSDFGTGVPLLHRRRREESVPIDSGSETETPIPLVPRNQLFNP